MMPHSRVAVRINISFSSSRIFFDCCRGRTTMKYVRSDITKPTAAPIAAPVYGPTCRSLPAAQAATTAATISAPCDRFSTPETPKISANPIAPRAYSEPTAKPSIRICQNCIGQLCSRAAVCAAAAVPQVAAAHEELPIGLTELSRFLRISGSSACRSLRWQATD